MIRFLFTLSIVSHCPWLCCVIDQRTWWNSLGNHLDRHGVKEPLFEDPLIKSSGRSFSLLFFGYTLRVGHITGKIFDCFFSFPLSYYYFRKPLVHRLHRRCTLMKKEKWGESSASGKIEDAALLCSGRLITLASLIRKDVQKRPCGQSCRKLLPTFF